MPENWSENPSLDIHLVTLVFRCAVTWYKPKVLLRSIENF